MDSFICEIYVNTFQISFYSHKMVLKQIAIICLMVTFARPNPDPCSEPQPGPLRGRRSPRPQSCPDLSDAGVYCRGKIETGSLGKLTRGTLTNWGAVR